MKVKWLGHACFLLTSDDGVRIVTDPYKSGAFGLNYGPPAETADIVTVSHEHDDHNNVADVKGNPEIVRGVGKHKVKGVEIVGVATSHDEVSGEKRGKNTVFCFTLDGVRVCHLGDLGHELSKQTLSEVGPVDVLLIPIGGDPFTIGGTISNNIANAIKPAIVIPMHFKTDRSREFPASTADDFKKMRQRVKDLNASETEIGKNALPSETETWVLKPAL